jgi:DNA-binding CsgD family transcriptional regulator
MVIELYGKELQKRVGRSSFRNVQSMDLVHLLKHDEGGNVGVWRLRLYDSSANVKDCFKGDGVTKEVQVLGREEGKGVERGPSFLVLLRRRSRPGFLLGDIGGKPRGGYLFGPISFRDGKIRLTFVGTQRDMKDLLANAEERGLQYRVVSIGDADFAEDSLLSRLTDRQRKILVLAYRLGYFDVPKKINSDELGQRLHLTGSTVVEHLSKAERRLLAGILDEQLA